SALRQVRVGGQLRDFASIGAAQSTLGRGAGAGIEHRSQRAAGRRPVCAGTHRIADGNRLALQLVELVDIKRKSQRHRSGAGLAIVALDASAVTRVAVQPGLSADGMRLVGIRVEIPTVKRVDGRTGRYSNRGAALPDLAAAVATDDVLE